MAAGCGHGPVLQQQGRVQWVADGCWERAVGRRSAVRAAESGMVQVCGGRDVAAELFSLGCKLSRKHPECCHQLMHRSGARP